MGNSLRAAVRSGIVPLREGSVLLKNRREFLKTVAGLAAAGMGPADFTPRDALGAGAVTAWREIEKAVPASTTLRETLWLDPVEVSTGRTPRGREVGGRLRDALEAAFGPVLDGDRRTVVHHGFYFYTPPQWQLFQVLSGLQEVDQVFVVHDDGQDPVYKTWRLFFGENDWEMPECTYMGAARVGSTPAQAYQTALTGRPIDPDALSTHLQVLTHRNAAEFARDWSATRDKGPGSPGSVFYGAASKALARLVRRLDRDQADAKVDLSELPVGSFLLALHRSIHTAPGLPPRLRLTGGRLLDIVSSGYLDVPNTGDPSALAALRRCIQFFEGCDDAHQWVTRAEALHNLVLDEVAARGVRSPAHDDLARISNFLGNPLRLVPWADLTVDEAAFVRDVVRAVVTLLDETVAQESATFNEHLGRLRDRIDRGLRDLPAAEADEVRWKFGSLGEIGETVVHVDEVIEIVQMVLGRKPDFAATGDDFEDDEDLVRPLRSLDVLGFVRSERPLHLANLSEVSFPSSVPGLGWPFTEGDLSEAARTNHEISLGILNTRSQHAGQSDLYLLHLALDGSPDPTTDLGSGAPPLTLSWVKEMDGDLHNASSLITLITAPVGEDTRVRQFVGGVPVHPWCGPSSQPAIRQVLEPAPVLEKLRPRRRCLTSRCSRLRHHLRLPASVRPAVDAWRYAGLPEPAPSRHAIRKPARAIAPHR